MENEQPKKLTLEDCKIDWNNYRQEDMYGCVDDDPSTFEESKALYKQICGYSEQRLVTRSMCYDYLFFGYYPDLLNEYFDQEKMDDRRREQLGLVKMFNEEWLTSPVFVNWHDADDGFFKDIRGYWIEEWLFLIKKAQTQVDILKHIIKNAAYIYGNEKKSQLPHLRALLDKCEVVARQQHDEAKRIAAAEKAKQKAKKEKPEYILSVDEIIQYVREENPDSAPSIRAMLRYFADEKEGWNSKAVKALLEPIKVQKLNFYGSVGAAVAQADNLTIKKQ